jgi:2-alkenal reductase
MKPIKHSPGYLFFAVLVTASLACNISIDMGQPSPTPETPTNPNNPELAEAVMPGILLSADLGSQQDALVSLYQTVSQGVVSLQIDSPIGTRQGSGFVIDTLGHIITNYHVVDRARAIEVVFQDGVRAEGTVLGADRDSDLAVVKVEVPEESLVPLVFGNSDEVQVGQLVIAIGNPFGLSGSMSTGVVSNLARTLPSLNLLPEGTEDIFAVGDLIQTDAAINPGNSGGPLLNLRGEVIGVNRAIRTFYYSSENNALSSGVGFAISINVVKKIVPSLIENGSYEYPYLGITSLTELTLTTAQESGLERTDGAYVRQIVSGGPAELAGLMENDLIIRINDKDVKSSGELAAYLLANTNPGDTVKLVVMRLSEEIEIELILGIRPVEECQC